MYQNLLKMWSRFTGSLKRAVWVISPSCIPQLGAMTVTVGTGGSVIPALTQSDGQFRLLTVPVIFSEKAKTLGIQGDVCLADFSAYAIGLRKEATLDRSMHVGFARDVETYRLQVRLDGQPTIAGPIAPLNGPTFSPFVVLETRA